MADVVSERAKQQKLDEAHNNSKDNFSAMQAMPFISTTPFRPVAGQQLVFPEQHDILCGSGHAIFSHPGNMRFRSIVANKAELYANAETRSEKSRITKWILFEVQSTGACVLKKDPIYPLWSPVVGKKREKVLRDKITHALRVFLTSRRRRAVGAAPSLPQRHSSCARFQEEQREENGKLTTIISLHVLLGFRPSLLTTAHFVDTGMPFLQLQHSNFLSAEEQDDPLSDGPAPCRGHSVERAGQDVAMVRTIQEMQESPQRLVPDSHFDVSLGSLFTWMLEESSIDKATRSRRD